MVPGYHTVTTHNNKGRSHCSIYVYPLSVIESCKSCGTGLELTLKAAAASSDQCLRNSLRGTLVNAVKGAITWARFFQKSR
mmetsp:Transcript_845/g.1630  ORF Transcript_845/g.1630 Transcript_845/m.1630 type:complete len:81 (+) Transcript_845:170-412(+)